MQKFVFTPFISASTHLLPASQSESDLQDFGVPPVLAPVLAPVLPPVVGYKQYDDITPLKLPCVHVWPTTEQSAGVEHRFGAWGIQNLNSSPLTSVINVPFTTGSATHFSYFWAWHWLSLLQRLDGSAIHI